MAWLNSNSNRSFADVLKGNGTSRPSTPTKNMSQQQVISPVNINATNSRASSSNSIRSPITSSNRKIPSPSLTGADTNTAEQRLQGARSPLRLSPVTVNGIQSDHFSVKQPINGVKKNITTSSTATSTKITKTTTSSTNTDLPRTPPMKRRTGNAWASPFLSKTTSVSSQTQTVSTDNDGFNNNTPTSIVRVTTSGTQTGENKKNDAGTSTHKDVYATSEGGVSDDNNNNKNYSNSKNNSPKQHFDKLFEGQYKTSSSSDNNSNNNNIVNNNNNRNDTMIINGAGVNEETLERNSTVATGGKSPVTHTRTPRNKKNNATKTKKEHIFRATKSPFVPSFMKTGQEFHNGSFQSGDQTQQDMAGHDKVYELNGGTEVRVSNQMIQRLTYEIVDFEKFTDELTKMFEEHIEKCINKTKHVIFLTTKSHYTTNEHMYDSKVKAPVIQVHGSFATKLWLPSSDVDMVVQNLLPTNKDGGKGKKKKKNAFEMLQNATSMLQVIAAGLEKEEWVGNLMMITTSNMPVIKFYSILNKGGILYKFPFDVSIDPGTTPDVPGFTHAHTGVPAKNMITHFLSVMPEFRAMMLVLKQLLRERGLNDTYRGGLSSYGLALMVTRFLQPFYPNLLDGATGPWVKAFKRDTNILNRQAISKHYATYKKSAVNREIPTMKQQEKEISDDIWFSNEQRKMKNSSGNTSPISNDSNYSGVNKKKNKPSASWASMVGKTMEGNNHQASSSIVNPPVSPVQSISPSLASSSSSPSSQSNDGPDSTATTASPQEDFSEKGPKDLKNSMGAKLLEFLHYFGNNFDYINNGLSIRNGGMYFRLNQKNVAQGLWIDDPISPGHNVAVSTFNARGVLNTFRDAFLSCVRHEVSEHFPTILSTVIRSSPWLEHSLHYAKNCKQEMWDSRRRASPEDYELAAEEIRQEIRKLSLEKQRMSAKKQRMKRKMARNGDNNDTVGIINYNQTTLSDRVNSNNSNNKSKNKNKNKSGKNTNAKQNNHGAKKKNNNSSINDDLNLPTSNIMDGTKTLTNRKSKHKNKSNNKNAAISAKDSEVKQKKKHRAGSNQKRKERMLEKMSNTSTQTMGNDVIKFDNKKTQKNTKKMSVTTTRRLSSVGNHNYGNNNKKMHNGPVKPTFGQFYFTGIARR